MLRNGVLAGLLRARPALRTLVLRNIDTVGADLDPGILGAHLQRGAALSFEVIPHRLEDRGGGPSLRVGGATTQDRRDQRDGSHERLQHLPSGLQSLRLSL